eukprot:TRINITY_DN243_c0_g1_i6.p2 TRINITY_DN243_c0_g1~~TRINITY_DN243_c0_g1_i6.p2  ORF type:complete len:152 (+),score=6.54 TRINITY_DN243_c0_g1_i6:432-887(+)
MRSFKQRLSFAFRETCRKCDVGCLLVDSTTRRLGFCCSSAAMQSPLDACETSGCSLKFQQHSRTCEDEKLEAEPVVRLQREPVETVAVGCLLVEFCGQAAWILLGNSAPPRSLLEMLVKPLGAASMLQRHLHACEDERLEAELVILFRGNL